MTESARGSADRPYPIRPIGPDEFDGFRLVDEHAFHGSPLSESDRQVVLGKFEFDRSLAAFDGTAPIGTAAAFTFLLSVPGGGMLPAAGVSWVSVLPTYRRRGVLTSLMRRQLADVRDRREPLAVLWASESAIYSRYGYGRASWYLDFTVKRGEAALAKTAPADDGLRLRIAEPPSVLGALAKVYDGVLQARPGLYARNDAWWQSAIHDPADSRHGASPVHCLLAEDASGPRGYALYSGVDHWEDFVPSNVLTVSELMAADPAASAALYADLLSRDLTSKFRIRRRPVDDPLLYQLADPRRSRPQLTDGLWVRLVDVPGALAGRRYAAAVDVVLQVRDELMPSNAGRWRLAGGGDGVATCVPAGAGAAADVALDVTELGAAYLGGTRLGALAGAGLVTELRPGAVRQLSAAMGWDPAPWCPMVF
jgi:predicted acetyltransferase